MSEETKGGRQGWVRRPRGVVRGGGGDQGGSCGVSEETKRGHQGWVRRPRGVILEGEEIKSGYIIIRPEGPQLAKRACPPRRGLEGEPRSGSNF